MFSWSRKQLLDVKEHNISIQSTKAAVRLLKSSYSTLSAIIIMLLQRVIIRYMSAAYFYFSKSMADLVSISTKIFEQTP